ncbi:MAG TPA: hypothetical protein ENN80_04010 [Candidatus Hydrogenedentes bacterium]|nr:hypothetical protein [Candidatus Hydrogenedentota bacterium]
MTKKAKVGLGVAVGVVVIVVLAVVVFDPFAPPYEEVKTQEAAATFPEVAARNAHVERIRFITDKAGRIEFIESLDTMEEFEKQRYIEGIEEGVIHDGDAPFVGDVVDANGNVIGEVRGFRVEGIGTYVRECIWFDGGPGE